MKTRKTKNGSDIREGNRERMRFNLESEKLVSLIKRHRIKYDEWEDLRYMAMGDILARLLLNKTTVKGSPLNKRKKQLNKIRKLLHDKNQIRSISIIKGDKSHIFKLDDHIFLSSFEAWMAQLSKDFDRVYPEPEETSKEYLEKIIEFLSDRFEGDGSERKKHLFIWDLLNYVGYPFDDLQLAASDTSKANLIGSWYKNRPPKND